MTDHKTIFSSLKKCNQVGKKLSSSGKYILIDGMMIGYQKPEMDETEAVGLGISFIEEKILNKMDAIPYIGIEIDGNLLYQTCQECEFIQFTIDKKFLYIEFKALEADDESNSFKEYAIEKGYKPKDIDIGLSSNFANDIDLYELYINYKKSYKPKMKTVIKSIDCRIIKDINDSKILKKCRKIIKQLEQSKFLGYKELQPEIFERLFTASQPIELKINIDDDKIYPIRLMKSVLNTATSKSTCEIRLLSCDDFSFLVIEITSSGFITCNVYRVINFN